MKAVAPMLLALVSALTLGCHEERSSSTFANLHYRRVSSAPGTVSLRPLEIEIERGLAVRARVSAIGADGEPMDVLELRSSDTSIFVIDLGPELGEYVFYGARAGSAEVDVYSDRKFQASIPATVLEQTP